MGERDKLQTQSCDATPDVWGYGSLGPCVMYAVEERYRDEIAPTVFDAVVESVGCRFLRRWARARRLGYMMRRSWLRVNGS
jgi:hypothetical protein